MEQRATVLEKRANMEQQLSICSQKEQFKISLGHEFGRSTRYAREKYTLSWNKGLNSDE